jgi:hypothetical protein
MVLLVVCKVFSKQKTSRSFLIENSISLAVICDDAVIDMKYI